VFRPVTDEDLIQFSKISSLKELLIPGSLKITDEGVANLASLSSLEKLDLGYTYVSEAARNKLKEALPNCEVQFSPLPE